MKELIKILKYRTVNKFNFILVLFLMISFSSGFSLNQQSKTSRQSALDAFSKGDFDKAYIQFNELSASYPRDPLYKYYCGVSLVKLERDPVKASTLLKEAQEGSGAIRTIPSDGLFYLGRAEQLSGNFSEAIKSYNLYTDQVGKKAAKESLTPQFIRQCIDRKGEIVISKTVNEEIYKKEKVQPADNEKVMLIEKNGNNNTDSTVNKEKSPSPEYEKLINETLNYQFRADSILKLADLYRKQYENAPVTDKSVFKIKIYENEQLADSCQKLANKKMVAAEKLTNSKSGQNLQQKKSISPDSAFSKKEKIPVVIQKVAVVAPDTSLVKKEETIPKVIIQKVDNQIVKNTDNQLVTKEKAITAQPKTLEYYSIFEIVSGPVSAANEKAQINPEVPAGLIYRVQLAVFRNQANLSYFKGIKPVFGFKNDASEMTNYYAGMFRKSDDASKALVKVKAAGFKDAFVVALFDKKIISAERAGILEKEWGNKPLISSLAQKIPDAPKDTVPPTLLFRVEVIKSQKPLNPEQLDNIKRLAGNRGLDVIKNESGQIIYLIGKFLTFDSAAEYADLLNRNGQKDAKVTAYLGSREIPVETAKQLFDKL